MNKITIIDESFNKKNNKYKRGDIFLIDDVAYILAQINEYNFNLISLTSGNRFTASNSLEEIIKCMNSWKFNKVIKDTVINIHVN